MSDLLEYKGYKGSVEFSSDDDLFVGKLLFIDSLILYHGSSVGEIKENFQRAIDEYLDHCKRANKEPNKTYTGTFNVRIGQERHRATAAMAYRKNKSINELVCLAIDAYLSNEGAPVVVNNHTHQHPTVVYRTHEESTFDVQSIDDFEWAPQTIQHSVGEHKCRLS